jgi:hypothetical protein
MALDPEPMLGRNPNQTLAHLLRGHKSCPLNQGGSK